VKKNEGREKGEVSRVVGKTRKNKMREKLNTFLGGKNLK